MKMTTKKTIAVFALALSASAFAQGKFPDGPIKMVVPFAPGGGVDVTGRLIAKQLQANLNVPVIVENKPGASGTIGARSVLNAPADGTTVLFSASTHVLTKYVMANAPYDPVTDFSYVARVGEAPLMMVISPDRPQTKLSEVIDAVKKNPEQWTAGLPALGAASHLATLMFANQGNLKLTTATYKGTNPALTDVAGGHAQLLVDSIIFLQGMAKTGKVKPIIVTSAKRSAVMPDVPTAVESGYPKFVANSWYGIWAPKATPTERLNFLNKAVNQAVDQLAKEGAFSQLGIEPVMGSSEAFKKYTQEYVSESAGLLNGVGFKPR